jgi:hypothetical protein
VRSQKSSAARSRSAPASGRGDLMPVLDGLGLDKNTPCRHRPGFAPDAMLSHAVQRATIEIDEEGRSGGPFALCHDLRHIAPTPRTSAGRCRRGKPGRRGSAAARRSTHR